MLWETKKCSQEALIEKIILQEYNRYYRLAYSYVHNEADAFDIVQNGVYKALRSAHTLKQPEFAATWVYRIILNEVFAWIRQPKQESYEYIQELRGSETDYTEDTYENVDLQRALDSLEATEKAIVIMKYFEDKKLEEIADILGENINTVKSRLYRSMKKLRLKLAEE